MVLKVKSMEHILFFHLYGVSSQSATSCHSVNGYKIILRIQRAHN